MINVAVRLIFKLEHTEVYFTPLKVKYTIIINSKIIL